MIPDSSVWIPYFRLGGSPVTRVIQALLNRDQALVVGVVMTEVLRGAQSTREFVLIASWMQKLPYLEPSKETWVRSGQISRDLRAKGITVHIVDALIATLAIEGGHEVYTWDTDFQRIPGLKLYEPATQG